MQVQLGFLSQKIQHFFKSPYMSPLLPLRGWNRPQHCLLAVTLPEPGSLEEEVTMTFLLPRRRSNKKPKAIKSIIALPSRRASKTSL